MIDTFFNKLRLIATDRSLRNKVLFILGAFILFRIFATIPIPGVDPIQLEAFFRDNEFLGLLNIFSGGGLSSLSIVMIGLSPYITAAIIMQLLTIMSPKLKSLNTEEGEAGRKKFTQYARLLTVPLAFIQAAGFLILLTRQGIIPGLDMPTFALNVLVVAAGSILLMWIGELVTEFGIGNGVSLLIFAGIVASLPTLVAQLIFTFDISQLPLLIAFTAATLVVTAAVVVMAEAERPVPISYARQVRGSKTAGNVQTYLPLRINQAGVIPIIFALSILLFPQMVLNLFLAMENQTLVNAAQLILDVLNNPWFYGIFYFVLVFLFTFFYTAVTFDPDSVANNLKKSGAFIPGVRPGEATASYLGHILTRITFFGACFLGAIAVLPLVMQGVTGFAALAIGGTALLITVTVVLDLVRKVDAQLSVREY